MTETGVEGGTRNDVDTASGIAVALVAGAGLALAARAGALELLVAVVVVQVVLALAFVFGLAVHGWFGALVVAGLAAAGADVAVSVWPQGGLGTMLAVLGLAVPVLFVHQLWRGAARARLVESLGWIAVLIVAEAALPALLQLRHEFATLAGVNVAFGVAVVVAGASLIGYLVDLVSAVPRFDPQVPRGLLAVLGAAAAGAIAGYLTLRDYAALGGGRGAFVGASSGSLVGLLAIAVAYLEAAVPAAEGAVSRTGRATLGVLLPWCFSAPFVYLLCTAIRA